MLSRLILRLADSLTARPADRGASSGVLLIAAGGLGDTVLFSRVVDRFRPLSRDDETITVLLRRDAVAMGFLLPPEIAVDSVDFHRLGGETGYRRATFKRLHEANFRLVATVDYLRHPFLDESLVRATKAAETAAMVARPWAKYDHLLERNRDLFDRLFDSGAARQDKVLRWAAFADWLIGTGRPPPTLPLAADELARFAGAADLAAPTVIMQPFSAVITKQPSVAFFAALIKALPTDHRVIITGAPADLERQPGFQALLDAPRVAFDGASFEDLVPRLRAARLVVSVDTALMHLATVVGAPTLCLASAAYVGEIVPYDSAIAPDNVTVLYESMPCEGCLGTCIHPLEDGKFPCVARLDASAAAARMDDILARSPPWPAP